MSRRSTISTVLAVTALAAPSGAAAMPTDPVVGMNAPAMSSVQVDTRAPAVPDGGDSALVIALAGSTLLAGVVGFGSGRLVTRRALLPQ